MRIMKNETTPLSVLFLMFSPVLFFFDPLMNAHVIGQMITPRSHSRIASQRHMCLKCRSETDDKIRLTSFSDECQNHLTATFKST